jgi:hypothetical protein
VSFIFYTLLKANLMKKINRASDIMGIKGTIPIKRESLHPNKNYTPEEQVLLLYLLSLPPEWILKQDWVIKKYNEVMGRDRVKKAWASLKLKGHLIKNRGAKFTDVYWMVYEIPPKDWNPVNPIPVDDESNNNNTEIKDTYIKETYKTSSSILEKSELEKNPLKNIKQIEIIRDDSAEVLISATKLESDIFLFDKESKFRELEKKIGPDIFVNIVPVLNDWIWAKNILNKNSSTTRRV